MSERTSVFAVVLGVLGTIFAGLVLLLFEHFQVISAHISTSKIGLSRIVGALVMSAVVAVATILCAKTLEVYVRSARYFREDFSFWASASILSLISACVLHYLTGVAPWSIFQEISSIYSGDKAIVDGYAQLIIAVLICACFCLAVNTAHSSWTGRRSVEQDAQDFNGEAQSFLRDAKAEVARLVRRMDARIDSVAVRQIHSGSPQPSAPEATRSWKDQCGELARILDWLSYDPGPSWLEIEQLWIGESRVTGEIVAVHPCETQPTEESVGRIVDTLKRIKQRKKIGISRLIVFSREAGIEGKNSKGGFPFSRVTVAGLMREISYGSYFHAIEKRHSESHSLNIPSATEIKYVPLEVETSDHRAVSLEAYANEWLSRRSSEHLVLLGDYGQGKSTFALHWAHFLISEFKRNSSSRLPILMELRGKSPRNLRDDELFGAWAARYGLNGRLFAILHELGRTILILDGFDEMALVGSSLARLEHFRALWAHANPVAKILVTGRPNLFFDTEEMRASLNMASQGIDSAWRSDCVRLLPFSRAKIKTFLSGFENKVSREILRAVDNNESFSELVSRPSLLFIAASLWKKGNISEKVSTLTSASILELFVRSCLNRQAEKQRSSQSFMVLNPAEREYFMEGVAAWIQSSDQTSQISGESLRDCVRKLLEYIPSAVSLADPAIDAATRMPLNVRLGDQKDRVGLVLEDVKSCGLLVSDPTIDGVFKFGHKSFLDYLVAKVTFRSIFEKGDSWYQSLRRSTNFVPASTMRAKSSLAFLGDMVRDRVLKRQGTGSVVEQLFVGLLGPSKPIVRVAKLLLRCAFAVPPYLAMQGGREVRLKIGMAAFIVAMSFQVAYLATMAFPLALVVIVVSLSHGLSFGFSTRASLWWELSKILGCSSRDAFDFLKLPRFVVARYLKKES